MLKYIKNNKIMFIYTILTKRSVRELTKTRKFLKRYSLSDFNIGDLIETIDGNKKNPTFILKKESISDMKELLRSGSILPQKLKLSKTGEFKNGTLIDHIPIDDIKKYLKNPSLANKHSNKNIKNFFPKKILKKQPSTNLNSKEKESKKGVESISDILKSKKFLKKHKLYHSETQEMVDTIRTYFNEKNIYGMGSFAYYMSIFKKVPKREIYQFFGEAKLARKPRSMQKRIFWFKIGKYIREKNFKLKNNSLNKDKELKKNK